MPLLPEDFKHEWNSRPPWPTEPSASRDITFTDGGEPDVISEMERLAELIDGLYAMLLACPFVGEGDPLSAAIEATLIKSLGHMDALLESQSPTAAVTEPPAVSGAVLHAPSIVEQNKIERIVNSAVGSVMVGVSTVSGLGSLQVAPAVKDAREQLESDFTTMLRVMLHSRWFAISGKE